MFSNISHKKFPLVSIYEYKKLKGGITLPGIGIFVYSKNDKALMQHEYGHYLDFLFFRKKYGLLLAFIIYYTYIGLPSLLVSVYSKIKLNRRVNFYTEKRADNLAKHFFADNYLTDKRFSTFSNT